MRLAQWVDLQAAKGIGELSRLRRVTGVAYTTIHRLARDCHAATYATAVKLSAATGGVVTVAELCELPPPRVRAKPAKRRRRVTKSKPQKRARSAGAAEATQ